MSAGTTILIEDVALLVGPAERLTIGV